ncbi:MAG: PilZ domain-containing protein [Bradyrhizobium sp.]|uniref:PilZ domain-containing protein n=1 Tax=Bradyrhizobium sp. TaxID=376 RepID=UPI0025C2C8F3|nr:PilZ domain-containing protein [Bradyrhizobium sp.]MBI5261687.1 PilZ domain-containing protein [Bradyrhizobium sp.]
MALTKKREARKSLSQPAWITLDGGFAARNCVVQDLSRSGARITLNEDASQLPGTVRLGFARNTKASRSCRVVWRRGRSAGIKFI